MDLGLKDKTVVITGGGSNIGRGIVHAFAAEGAKIIIAELAPDQGEKVRAEIQSIDPNVQIKVIATDVTDQRQVESMIEEGINTFGHIDCLINNVGWTIDRLFLDKPREEYEKEANEKYKISDAAEKDAWEAETKRLKDKKAERVEKQKALEAEAEPGQDLFKRSARQLEFLLGTPDAVGDGIIGYRTDRSSTQ